MYFSDIIEIISPILAHQFERLSGWVGVAADAHGIHLNHQGPH